MILGPASALLEQELAQEVRRQGIVVWLDRDCSFTDFVQRLTERHAAGDFEHPVVGFRGSFMELLFALEAHGSGYDRTPLLIHMPGFNEDSIRETPVLELYSAGTRFRKALDTLIRQAATGRVAPDQVDQFLADKPTLEQADAWLGQASSRSSMGLPALLEASGPMLMIEALCGAESTLARQVKTESEVEALRDYLHTLTGMDAEWREFLPKNGKSDFDGVLTALGAWLLCVEYVHDLRREPHLPALRRLKGVAPTLVKMSCKLVSDLRDQHADAYERLATDVEGLIQGELEVMTAEDLGQIDTFCEEEERVLAGAVAALKAQDWQKAQSWCKAREGDRSFWIRRDQTRRLAWDVVAEAAAFGATIAQQPRPFAEITSHEDALARYAETAFRVDRAHRRFEQERARRLDHRVPHFGSLQEVVGILRQLHRDWANQLAKDFTRVCRSCGFLPEPDLRQRNLYEQVVQPLTLGGERVAVFLIDAFRYEMATELFEELRGGSGTQSTVVDLKPRLAELPTITSVGMNALAPVAQGERLTVVGSFQGFRAGEFTVKDPEGRSRAMGMRTGGRPALHISLGDLCDRTQEVLGKLKDHQVVVVHSTEIDSAGESNLGVHAFEATLRQLRAAWHHLQGKGIKQAVFTADHGFLLQDATTKIVPFGKKTDPHRRYVVDQHERGEAGLTPVPLASLGYDGISGFLLLREDTAAFATKDVSVAFDHGGNSPQERIIPVLTVSRKQPEGVCVAQYEAEAKAEDDALGFHRLSLRLVFPRNIQNNLAYVGPRTVDLDLRVPGRADIRALVREVSGAGILKAGRIQAPVKEEWVEVFFSLEGTADERVPVEVYHPDNIHRVQPKVVDGLFAVVGKDKDAVVALRPDWASAIDDEGTRGIFLHLAEHRSITEEEIIRKLGTARAARRFALGLDENLKRLPFKVRSETNASGKRYVREEDN
ncbi:MAG: BREX-6 system phosphatase PglZ [Polyangia bacterium]